MNTAAPKSYTASQIGAALAVTRQTCQKMLDGVAPDTLGQVNGQKARLYSIPMLPERLRERLAEAAREGGYPDIEHLLEAPRRPWEPRVPYTMCSDHYQKAARMLRDALARALEGRKDCSLTRQEWLEQAVAEYKAVFGHPITFRRWYDLFYRTLERGGESPDFTSLDLYLPERPARRIEAKPASLNGENEFCELQNVINEVSDPAVTMDVKKELVWRCVSEYFDEMVASGKGARKLKRSLIQYLAQSAPFLAPNAEALRVAFHRKYDWCVRHGRDPQARWDGRKNNPASQRAAEPPEKDLKLLTAGGASLGGGKQQAWRMMRDSLSGEIQQRYPGTNRMPARIDRMITPGVKTERIRLKGPKNAKMKGAYVDRDPSGIASGDWDQSDDMTMINVWWEESPNAPGGYWFGQGQLLVWVDERSWFAYGWDLISDPHYDAFSIRNSWTAKAATWGPPRKGLSLECGIWKTSRLIVGEKSRDRDGSEIPLAETALGLRRLGLRFHHFTEAKGKVIERIYGMFQNYFQAAPGYVGRNPITDRQEEVQKKILLVKSGKAHPSDFFLHKLQWRQILDRVLVDYNQTPLGGKYHEGRSPKQVFEDCFSTPLVMVPEGLRYLLATNRYERVVGGNGISFKFGKQVFRYKGYELGKRRWKKVVAYFNCENPETICCTDEHGQHPFLAEREQRVFNHDPLPGTLEKALSQNAAQNRYQKELHRSLKPYYNSEFFSNLFRPCLVDGEAVETSKEFARLGAEFKSKQDSKRESDARAQVVYARINTLPPPDARPEEIEAAAKLSRKWRTKNQ